MTPLKEGISNVNEMSKTLNELNQKLEKEINDAFDELVKMMNDRRNELVSLKPLQNNKYLKFIYSEKTRKFCKIPTLLLSYVVPIKSNYESF